MQMKTYMFTWYLTFVRTLYIGDQLVVIHMLIMIYTVQKCNVVPFLMHRLISLYG